ncbi:SAM-dependent methyltransferase, partial [Streptomyces sp. NPDC047081]|uniref:SAM-dependent methyltransferase n=1 Tax=Streptomyces sp. NPDC047081 TaxID=3154706 RepID=UPI0033E1D988
HARALLTSSDEGRTDYIDADLRRPAEILEEAALPPAQAAPPAYTRPPMHDGVPGDRRPALPQRHAQEHLAPELRDTPAPRKAEEQDKEHDPGLMALFQRGIRLADNEPDEPPTGSTR